MDFAVLRRGKAGSRFQDYRKYKRQRRDGNRISSRVFTFGLGTLLIVVGLLIGWLPGPGGFVALIGLAMLGREIPWIPRVMDSSELILRRLWTVFCIFPGWLRYGIAGAAVALAVVSTWIGFRYFFGGS